MLKLISPKLMRECEQAYFNSSGTPSIEMMERAAQVLFHAVCAGNPAARRIYIACGPGGNGGDGYACARLMHLSGISCTIFPSAEARHADAIENYERAKACGVKILSAREVEACPVPDIWLDCLYGTGLSRAPEGDAAALIERMLLDRERGAKIISADIPSGLNGETGKSYAPCVRADVTIAIEYAKLGHFLQDGLDSCGAIDVRGIGFPASAFPMQLPRLIESADLRALMPKRHRNIHKGECGHLLLVAGSRGMAGAAALCARAALRSGVGLVSIACIESIVPILQTLAPCAMCIPLPEENGAIAKGAVEILQESLQKKSAIVVGCGLSTRVPEEILRVLLEAKLPSVIDADAINMLSLHPSLKELLMPCHILTPHPGEAARLLGRRVDNPYADVLSLAQLGATVVLKGASRVIAGKRCLISASGSSGMARGGSGDVFAGILGALLAERAERTYEQTAALACELHGLAGVHAEMRLGARAMNACDLIDALPEVFAAYVD